MATLNNDAMKEVLANLDFSDIEARVTAMFAERLQDQLAHSIIFGDEKSKGIIEDPDVEITFERKIERPTIRLIRE